jgi:hypothetical protein
MKASTSSPLNHVLLSSFTDPASIKHVRRAV